MHYAMQLLLVGSLAGGIDNEVTLCQAQLVLRWVTILQT